MKACACLQIDDPLDAVAVHAFNGTWGVWAVGLFAAKNQVLTSYGSNPYTSGDREYGCFLGGSGRLLAAQVVYSIWLGGMPCLPLLNSCMNFCTMFTVAAVECLASVECISQLLSPVLPQWLVNS